MGVFKNVIIETTDPSERVNAIDTWINQNFTDVRSEILDDYMHDDAAYICSKITFTNSDAEILFGYIKSSPVGVPCSHALYYVKKDQYIDFVSETEKHTSNNNVNNVTINAYVDTNCIVFAINELHGGKPGCELALVNCTDSIKTIGFYNMVTPSTITTDQYVDISNLTFRQVSDISNVPYAYTNMFRYTAPAPTIDFLGQAYFTNNNVKRFTTDILKECSTVTMLSTVSLMDGNYIALGAHCLAPVGGET